MDVHIVTANNSEHYRLEMDQYYFERHKIYAEELRWVPEVWSGPRFTGQSAVGFRH